MPTHSLIFLRHGAVANPREIIYGDLPGFPLSAAGRQGVAAAAGRLRTYPFTRILTSPQDRAVETAELVRVTAFPSLPIEVEPRLREWVYAMRGLTLTEWRQKYPSMYAQFTADPANLPATVEGQQYETLTEVGARVWSLIEECRQGPDRAILLVSHGGPINMALALVTGQDYRQVEQEHGLLPGEFCAVNFTGEGVNVEFSAAGAGR